MDKPDHVIYAHESLLATPQGFLRFTLLFAILGVTATALAEFGTMWLLMHQRFIDDVGTASASGFMVSTVAVMTLALYWLAGSEWQRGQRQRGRAYYAVAVVILLWAVWDWARPWNSSLWFDFSGDAGNLISGNAGKSAPGWFQLLIDLPLAIAFSACGLLFIRSKRHLAEVVEQWRNQQTALAKIAQDRQARAAEDAVARREAELAHIEAHRASLTAYMVRRAHDGDGAAIEARRDELLNAAQDIRIPQFRSHQLIAEADRLSQQLAGGDQPQAHTGPPPADKPGAMAGKPKTNGTGKATAALLGLALLLRLSAPHPAYAQSASDQCATAPVFQLLLDVSGSSPLADRQYLAAVIPVIDERIRALPMCSSVLIVTVGDARTVPSMPRLKVLARTVPGKGATRDEIARDVQQLLASMPDHIAKKPDSRSELVTAFADASRNTNPQAKAPNQVVMLSDGVEYSSLANCGTGRCRFPAPRFSLAGTTVAIYGVGLGLSGERAMALTNTWEKFFAKAGVKADLRRTF